MRRFLFFLLMLVAIAASVCLLVLGIPSLLDAPAATAFDYLKSVFELVKSGNWQWETFNSATIFTYGYVLFLLVNAVLLLSLLVMALTTLFRLSKVYRFYSTVWWYFFAALVFTGVNAYAVISAGGDIMDNVLALPWQFFVPIGSAVVLAIIGIVFKVTERKV